METFAQPQRNEHNQMRAAVEFILQQEPVEETSAGQNHSTASPAEKDSMILAVDKEMTTKTKPSPKKAHIRRTIAPPSLDLLVWWRGISKKQSRKHIARGMRVKVS
jgi:hypothetical protein